MASEKITTDVFEANEFPELANRYDVYGVPHTVINETVTVEGAVPEPLFVEKLMSVMNVD